MLKKPTIYLAIFSLSVFSTVAQDDAEFEQYLKEQQTEFQEFQDKREQEFQAFVERWREAEQAYRKEVAEKWDASDIENLEGVALLIGRDPQKHLIFAL